VKDCRATSDPLAHLSGFNAAEDVRHARRALPPVELGALLGQRRTAPRYFAGWPAASPLPLPLRDGDGLPGRGTGFPRAESFALDAEPTTVVCRAAYAKNGKTATQPLRGRSPRRYAATSRASQPDSDLAGSWHERAADIAPRRPRRRGHPYVVEGPDGPCMPTFHALRHSYVALLDRAGLTLKAGMQLAGTLIRIDNGRLAVGRPP